MHSGQVIDLVSRIRRRAHERIAEDLRRLGHSGLAPSHGAILAMLYGRDHRSMGELAAGVGLRKNTLTVLVRKLEAGGYVRRESDPQDNRVVRIGLTPKGAAFRADFEDVSRRVLAKIWGDMDEARQAALMRDLETLLRNLD